MRGLLGRGLRAALLLATSLGLALGLAATTVYDHPAESSSLESFCLTLAEELAAPPVVLPDLGSPASGDLTGLALAVLTVAGVLFAVLLGRTRFDPLPRFAPRQRDAVPVIVPASRRRVSSRSLLLTLSVIRI